MADDFQEIEVSRIFLASDNPRHDPLESQDEIIAHMCANEQIYELARHICQEGSLNPMEQIGVMPLSGSGKRGTKKAYEVWEGNRRICAIQLLNDPEKAPASLRKRFDKLSETYEPIRKVRAVVFDNQKRLESWIKNMHDGAQGGVGRKNWGAEEKQRFSGTSKNAIAQELLDKAEGYGFITVEERKNKLTTLTRYVTNREMKSVLGLDTSDPSEIKTDLTEEDFKSLLKILIDDLRAGKLSSRHNSDVILPYARSLPKRAGASTKREEFRPVKKLGPSRTGKTRTRKITPPKKPAKPTKIAVFEELQKELEASGNQKLTQLYYSLCDISTADHTLLIAAGAWAFVECLTAATGRKMTVPFNNYYNSQFLEKLGWTGAPHKAERGVIKDAFDRLSRGGNTTKHHALTGTFDAQQIISDMEVVAPVLVKTLQFSAQ